MGIREVITKTGKHHRAEVTVNGRTYDRTFKREVDAVQYEQDMLSLRVKHSGSNQYLGILYFGRAWTELVHDKQEEGKEDCTIKEYLGSSKQFQKLFEKDVTKITDKEIEEIFKNIKNQKNGNQLSISHYKAHRNHVCAVLRKAVDMGYPRPGIDKLFNKLTAIVKVNGKRTPRYKSYTQDEVDKIVAYVPNQNDFWVKSILLILLITGKRIGEVLGLTRDKIDYDNNTIRIEQMISKQVYHPHLKHDAEPETIKMDSTLRIILEDLIEYNESRGLSGQEWLFPSPFTDPRTEEIKYKKGKHVCPYGGKPLTREVVGTKTKLLMQKVGIPQRHLHHLRKTSCTLNYVRLASNPLAGEILRKKMNHKSAQTTFEFYIEVPDEVIEQHMGGVKASDIVMGGVSTTVQSSLVSKRLTESEDSLRDLENQKRILELELELLEMKKKKAA